MPLDLDVLELKLKSGNEIPVSRVSLQADELRELIALAQLALKGPAEGITRERIIAQMRELWPRTISPNPFDLNREDSGGAINIMIDICWLIAQKAELEGWNRGRVEGKKNARELGDALGDVIKALPAKTASEEEAEDG